MNEIVGKTTGYIVWRMQWRAKSCSCAWMPEDMCVSQEQHDFVSNELLQPPVSAFSHTEKSQWDHYYSRSDNWLKVLRVNLSSGVKDLPPKTCHPWCTIRPVLQDGFVLKAKKIQVLSWKWGRRSGGHTPGGVHMWKWGGNPLQATNSNGFPSRDLLCEKKWHSI